MSEGTRPTRDRALLYALIAIVVALLLNTVVASAPACYPVQQANNAKEAKGRPNGNSVTEQIGRFAYAPFCAVGAALYTHREVINSVSTVVIGAFTIVLAWSTIKLWRETERLAKGAEKQTADLKRSIDASERTATASEQSVERMKDTAERQLRAYISVVSGTIGFIPELPDTLEAHLLWVNSGRTPAYDVTSWSRAAIFDLPYQGVLPGPPSGPISNMPSKNVIGSNCDATLVATLPNPPTQEQLVKMTNFKTAVFVWGEIRYVDAFGTSRITNFRYRSIGHPNAPHGRMMAPADKGNEAT